MHPELPALLPLCCPACRRRDERGRHVFTVSLAEVFARDEEGAVEEGLLRCDNPDCGRRYPIFGGIPLLRADLAPLLQHEWPALLGALPPRLQALLLEAGAERDPLPAQAEHLSVYLDAGWGAYAEPPPEGPGPAAAPGANDPYQQLGADSAARPVARAVELGCGVGRGLWELSRGAGLVVGVDLRLGALRCARALLAGRPLPYLRRHIGRHYQEALLRPPPASGAVALVYGDALDPPLVPGAFDRVAGLSVLDSVPSPRGLLAVADGLCRPGGELILAAPYAWQDAVLPAEERLGGAEPAAALRALLSAGQGEGLVLERAYEVLAEAELPWCLRRDRRAAHLYQVHYLRARKAE